jgi:hypothetical protein
MLNKSIDLVQLSTNAHNLIDMARADVQFVLQCRRNEWDRALITAKTFSNYSQVEYEIRYEENFSSRKNKNDFYFFKN